MRKAVVSLTVLVLLVFSFALKGKREFSVAPFYSPLSYQQRWECACSLPQNRIDDLLSQKFQYLGSGAQMVAFLGEDGCTVLKFFKMNHLLPKKWLALLPISREYRERKTTLRTQRLNATFRSIKLACEKVPEETGVIFAQINPGKKRVITLIDKQNNEHRLDLKRVPFVLQKRAELIYTRLLRHLKNGDLENLQLEKDKILSLVERRCQKGIFDSDSGVSANYGFVGEDAVQIDIGELSQNEGDSAQEIARIRQKIEERIKKQG